MKIIINVVTRNYSPKRSTLHACGGMLRGGPQADTPSAIHPRPMAEATSGDRNRKRRTAMLSLVECL